ncbi:MAG: T9SS type A sorting domain-containing protein [Chryseolinea sp.]
MKIVKILNDISTHRSSLLISYKGLWIAMLLIVFSFIQPESTYAQLARFPVQRKNPSTISKSKKEVARTKAVSLSLPFWDDFSFTPINDTSNAESNVPLTSLWSKGGRVWINDGLGINVPTINVASFDGLDSLGLPYSDQVLANGFRDTLQSQPIDLSAIIGADTNTVFLSFFYQWQGNGEPPDPTDYMRVEFKDSTDAWIDILTINTKSSFDKTVFYDTILQVKGKRFFHNSFQFRFKNYGRQSGPFDTWNIDYVYLNKGRTINDTSFPDQAVASSFSPLFGSYYAMPIKHFFAALVIDSVEFDVNNLMNNTSDYISESYVAKARFTNHSNSSSVFSESILDLDRLVDDGLIEEFERTRVKLDNLPNPANPSQFNPSSDSIEVELNVKITSNGNTNGEADAFLPNDLTVNDSISTRYYLDDYYAYDDGIAEYSVGLTHAGNRVAYQFTRPANIPDSLAILNGFDIYFPRFGVTNSLTVDFVIYADDGGKPGDVLYTFPNYLIKQTGINVFQFVEIRETVFVGNTYYVGWKAPVNGIVVVGLDVSNNTGEKMIVYTNGQWDINDAVEGSIMLRPHFGSAIYTGIEDEKESLQIFPNPSKGEFFVKGKYDRLEIITVTGQSIPFISNPESENTRITIPNPTSGLYIVKIIKGNALQTKKIVID